MAITQGLQNALVNSYTVDQLLVMCKALGIDCSAVAQNQQAIVSHMNLHPKGIVDSQIHPLLAGQSISGVGGKIARILPVEALMIGTAFMKYAERAEEANKDIIAILAIILILGFTFGIRMFLVNKNMKKLVYGEIFGREIKTYVVFAILSMIIALLWALGLFWPFLDPNIDPVFPEMLVYLADLIGLIYLTRLIRELGRV